jgi:hypothetical protein
MGESATAGQSRNPFAELGVRPEETDKAAGNCNNGKNGTGACGSETMTGISDLLNEASQLREATS